MITKDELIENGFEWSDYCGGFVNENYGRYTYTLEKDTITYVRYADSYDGISLKIETIEALFEFVKFLSND